MALSNNDDLRDAHYLFGILYEKGLSVEVSQKTAFECFKKAASL
jgi:TPR repeat protein